jgi:hypothetical protein
MHVILLDGVKKKKRQEREKYRRRRREDIQRTYIKAIIIFLPLCSDSRNDSNRGNSQEK